MTTVAWTLKDNGLSLLIDGKSMTLNKDHANYNAVKDALREKRYEDIPKLIDLEQSIRDYLSGDHRVSIIGGIVRVDDYSFSEAVSDKVLRMIRDGFDPEPLLNFLRKVMANPSFAARQELLLFCFANDFLIHEDGDIIAYKSTGEDYLSIHTNSKGEHVRYMVGDKPSMERGSVDDDRHRTCSFGLHFAAYKYASTWAGSSIRHVMIVKINPSDVVAIPSDYSNQKGRTCRMEVIGERTDFTPLPLKEVYTDRDVRPAPADETVADIIRDFLGDATDLEFDGASTLDDLDLGRFGRNQLRGNIEARFDIELDAGLFEHTTTVDSLIHAVKAAVDHQEDVTDSDEDEEPTMVCPQCMRFEKESSCVSDTDGTIYCSDACLLAAHKA